jgi:hypothetical protein
MPLVRLLSRMPIRHTLARAVGFSATILHHRALDDRIDQMRTAAALARGYALSLRRPGNDRQAGGQASGFVASIRTA